METGLVFHKATSLSKRVSEENVEDYNFDVFSARNENVELYSSWLVDPKNPLIHTPNNVLIFMHV